MRLAALALATIIATPALAEDPPEIAEIRTTWEACTQFRNAQPDGWTGWRRNFDGGYSDHFQFYEGGDGSVSVLVQTWLIDAIAIQEDISCFRTDGSLAFIFSSMVSPNMAQGYESPSIEREGRIYFANDGRVVRILGRILEGNAEVAPMDNDRYMLARGCELTQPHMVLDDVRAHQSSELGDIEGGRPAYEPTYFAWCNDPLLNQ